MASHADNHEHTVRKAAQENPDDAEYYENASKHVANHTNEHKPPSDDEVEEAKQAHHKIYRQGKQDDLESMGADAVGGAVATEAIQKFLGGGGGGSNDLVAFAMTQASQLLGGNADPGFKGQVMQKVAMMAFKSQLGGSGGGGGGGGNAMIGMLQKFL
ncbi:hypothetical protein B0H15DRAFT_207327 [Mycena belliarum]|uniref:DUF7721 domain-containing protein n=1 Tax=Mycena belliarum TaxID=1033014 RepID=A0AAD6XU98_9AGAR|nr:hypothetical protein B0H15DRAFT_207327 [Mycena belliae]